MEVEHVARVGFAAWWAAQQQGHLAVGHSLFGQVVVHDQCVFAAVTEVLAHGAAGIGRHVLHGSRFGRRCCHHDGEVHRASRFQRTHHVLDRRRLLTDGDVDASDALALLGNDGVDGHSRLAGLAVANDQLALATAHRHHRVNRLDAGLQRLVNRLAGNHAWSNLFDHVGHLGVDRAFAVDRLAQRVDHTANQLRANRHFQNAARALDGIAFGDVLVLAQNHGADRVALEVQCQTIGRRAIRAGGELQHFTLHCVGQTVHAHDTVGHGHDSALVADVTADGQPFNAALDQFRNLCGIELHDSFLLSLFSRNLTRRVTR